MVVENHASGDLDEIASLLVEEVFELLFVKAVEFPAGRRINDRQSMCDEINVLQLAYYHARAFPLARGNQCLLKEGSRLSVQACEYGTAVVVQVQSPSRSRARAHLPDSLEDAPTNTLIRKRARQHVCRLVGHGLHQRPKDPESPVCLFCVERRYGRPDSDRHYVGTRHRHPALQFEALPGFSADTRARPDAPSLHMHADQLKGALRVLEDLHEHDRRNGILQLRLRTRDPEAERRMGSSRQHIRTG